MGQSQAFDLLHDGIRRWIWSMKWDSLRDIQERAIPVVLAGDRDVIISASTAAGKTEAAFLPALTRSLQVEAPGVSILYVSPLKALINDQFRRLDGLCENLDIPLTPWHGDVPLSVKKKLENKPGGVLLITPESLEAMLLNKGAWCRGAFSTLQFVILDEYHAFLGSERGCQLASLLHRLEFLTNRTIPRIALSATLADMDMVGKALRPSGSCPLEIVNSDAFRSDLKVRLHGYIGSAAQPELEASIAVAFEEVIDHLYRTLRGGSHLVFANSRAWTEMVASALREACLSNNVPNEFFPHHGSLSKDIREALEARLQKEDLPTTAVCTMTLELGIDIGKVDSIAQVGAPGAVSSLRQRLGRSGRRRTASVLRLYMIEQEIRSDSAIGDQLRLETFQGIAMVQLLLKKWCEPAADDGFHFSTLVQQTLSVVGQYGAIRADQLWTLLCGSGPFFRVDQKMFVLFLRALGEAGLLTQTHDRLLVLGVKGERLVGHFTFYAAFSTPEEYRLVHQGKQLGTLPISQLLVVGQLLIFAGKRWQVAAISQEDKRIDVKAAKGGRPPKFSGAGQQVHDMVRREMLNVYRECLPPSFLDVTGRQLFAEGVQAFHDLSLGETPFVQRGGRVSIVPWRGDKIVNTLVSLLCAEGFGANAYGGVIDIENSDVGRVLSALGDIARKPRPAKCDLARKAADTRLEKHDGFIPEQLRQLDYGAKIFDVDGAWDWIERTLAAESRS